MAKRARATLRHPVHVRPVPFVVELLTSSSKLLTLRRKTILLWRTELGDILAAF